MNRRVRLLSVMTACLALLGGAAVVTHDAPQGSNDEARTDRHRSTTNRAGTNPTDSAGLAAGVIGSALTTPGTSIALPPKNRPAGESASGSSATSTPRDDDRGPTTTTWDSGTTSTTTGPSGPKCPDPKTCDVYTVINEDQGGPYGGTKGWRPRADGIVLIPFYVKPTPPAGSDLTESTMEAAIIEGTRIIEAQNPRIRFEHKGRTPDERIPERFDGYNDFQFGDKALQVFDAQGYIIEADIRPSTGMPAGAWAYTPCAQRDDSCGGSGSGKREILPVILHEQFHTMGAGDLYGPDTSRLTMDAAYDKGDDRESVTPGLGDVLGLRALYPTSAPMPTIYRP